MASALSMTNQESSDEMEETFPDLLPGSLKSKMIFKFSFV